MDVYAEEWRFIPDWDNRFELSNYGRMRRWLKYKKCYYYYNWYKDERTGYYYLNLSYKGKRETWLVQRLVATVFQRPLLKTEQCHHKNRFKFCNCNFNIQIIDGNEHAKFHSEDVYTKQKRVSKIIGRKHTQEHINKMLATKEKNGTLHISPMKGKKHSQQTKQKMSQTRKGEKNPHFGKHLTDEEKKHLSQLNKGKTSPLKGIKKSAEHVAKIQETRRQKRLLNPNYGKRGKAKTK